MVVYHCRIVAENNIDTIVLVDAGVDSIFRGDEESMGTFHEDAMSLAAMSVVPVAHKYLMCSILGSGEISSIGNYT